MARDYHYDSIGFEVVQYDGVMQLYFRRESTMGQFKILDLYE